MRRAIFAATLGNGLEFYDFITFAFFAIQIGNTFFPSGNAYLSLMGSLATFGAGFITRPIGAHVLGGYADRKGRKPAMLLSMTLMGAGICLLSLSPGYAKIGFAAPVIAVIARLLQGFALGGEVGSATTYMVEAAPDAQRGRASSWQGVSQNVAATLGSAVGLGLSFFLTTAELDSWGWRVALLVGASVVPMALYIRSSLPETHIPAPAEQAQRHRFADYRRIALLGAAILGSGTIIQYIFNYMATFGQHELSLSTSVSFAAETAINAIGAITIFAGGVLSDRFGRVRVMLVPQCILAILIIPCFLWLTTARDATSFIGANVLLSGSANLAFGPLLAAISEGLPRMVRARVVALVYAIPIATLGGTTQLFVTWLLHVTGSPMALAWYLTAVSLVGALAMAAMPETAPVRKAA